MNQNLYTGVIHVRTDRSGGAGTLAEVVESAKKNGVDFVVLADRGTLGYGLENEEGWHDGVLVLCAEETQSRRGGGFLAFETREEIGERETMADALADLRRQYGSAVSIGHQLPGAGDANRSFPPDPLAIEDADLIGLWSFMDEFLARTDAKSILKDIARAEKLIVGPDRKFRRRWDRVLEQKRLPAIGTVNCQPRKDPLLEWKVLFPYDLAFQTIATCIYTTELPNVWLRARDLVWTALREGHSYMVNRSVGPEKGFLFEFIPQTGRRRQMGDDVPYTPNGKFHIVIPEKQAEVVLRHNGQPLVWTTTREITFPPAGPGSYRVEVNLNRRTWILSNPIRLVDEEGVMQPTVSDIT